MPFREIIVYTSLFFSISTQQREKFTHVDVVVLRCKRIKKCKQTHQDALLKD
jgi:hypothetical protein